jgi:Ca2+:H+ antiporter
MPGVVLLHLLLVPGTTFLTGGARIWEQKLHPHRTQLNLTLLTVGSVPNYSRLHCRAMLTLNISVLALTIPAAFFAAIDGNTTTSADSSPSDSLRRDFLRISRGFAVILLVMCVPFQSTWYRAPVLT